MVDGLVANSTRSLWDPVFRYVEGLRVGSIVWAEDALNDWERLRARAVVRVRDALIDRSRDWSVDDDDDGMRDGCD